MQEKDIERILNKRKPTANDTLTLMLNDIIQNRITALADKKGTLPPEASHNIFKHYPVVAQDDYSKVVLKLSEKEYKKHQRNVRLYNFYYDVMDEMEKEHERTLVYFKCLLASFDYDVRTYPEPFTITETESFTTSLQQYIAENIRAIKGFNYFVDVMKEETKNEFLEITKIEVKDLREAYKNYLSHIRTMKDTEPELYEQYTELIREPLTMLIYFGEPITSQIKEEMTGLNCFDNINSTDHLKAIIKRNTFAFIREGTTKEEIEQQIKERQQDRENDNETFIIDDLPDNIKAN